MRRYIFTFTLIVVAGLWSCERDTLTDDNSTRLYDSSQIINILSQTEQDSISTSRGTPITSEQQLTTMGVFCAYTGTANWTSAATSSKMFNTSLTRNSTSGFWAYTSTPVNWGATSSKDCYSFFAYAPFATTQNGITVQGSSSTAGIPSIQYSVPTNATSQPDLMIAVPRYNLPPATSVVAMQMKHALTCVGFQIKGNGEKVRAISISGVSASGNLTLNGSAIAWSNLATVLPQNIFSPILNFDAGQSYVTAQSTTSTNLLPGNGYLMMIPQTLGPNAKLTLTFSDNSTRQVSLNTLTWEAGKKVTYNIIATPNGVIVITPQRSYIASQGSNLAIDKFQLVCTPETSSWTLTSSQSWALLSTNADGSNASQTITGVGSKTIYAVVSANTATTERQSKLTIPSHSSNSVVTLTQLQYINTKLITSGGALPIGVKTYVGAFWRAAETGERIIRIPIANNAENSNAWVAWVAWQDGSWLAGDIVFSTSQSADSGISYTADATPGNAESYQITGSNLTASGSVDVNETIYFRIGLKSKYIPTAEKPARYAIVALSYGNRTRTQLIYLRQGEGADYVMREVDSAVGTYINPTRPMARKLSPYNLTASGWNNWIGGPLITNHLDIPLLGGIFTDFPTQAGALYQWASPLLARKGYHPTVPTSRITGWDSSYGDGYWSQAAGGNPISQLQEICPNTYKRMNDGPEDGPSSLLASSSEMRQSLFSKLTNGDDRNFENTMVGYYADGFFDRRRIKTSITGEIQSAVSSNMGTNSLLNAKAAYIGTLFFNPTTGASLFFPSGGVRNLDDGSLVHTGLYGFYWLASSKTDKNTSLMIQTGSANIIIIGNEFNRPTAQSLRCVKKKI